MHAGYPHEIYVSVNTRDRLGARHADSDDRMFEETSTNQFDLYRRVRRQFDGDAGAMSDDGRFQVTGQMARQLDIRRPAIEEDNLSRLNHLSGKTIMLLQYAALNLFSRMTQNANGAPR